MNIIKKKSKIKITNNDKKIIVLSLRQFSFRMTHCIKNLKTCVYKYFYNIQIKSSS